MKICLRNETKVKINELAGKIDQLLSSENFKKRLSIMKQRTKK